MEIKLKVFYREFNTAKGKTLISYSYDKKEMENKKNCMLIKKKEIY